MKDFLKTLRLIWQYNYFKIIFLSIIYLSCIVFNNSEPNIYKMEVKDVVTKGETTYYITSYGSEIESIKHESISKELNGDKKFKKGEYFKYYSTSGWSIVSIIFVTIFTIMFIVSLFDEYGDWKGFKIRDIKIELFGDKVEIHESEDGSLMYVYNNRVFYTGNRYDRLSNTRLYDSYKIGNKNNYPIFIEKVKNKSEKKKKANQEEKIKEIMKFLDD